MANPCTTAPRLLNAARLSLTVEIVSFSFSFSFPVPIRVVVVVRTSLFVVLRLRVFVGPWSDPPGYWLCFAATKMDDGTCNKNNNTGTPRLSGHSKSASSLTLVNVNVRHWQPAAYKCAPTLGPEGARQDPESRVQNPESRHKTQFSPAPSFPDATLLDSARRLRVSY